MSRDIFSGVRFDDGNFGEILRREGGGEWRMCSIKINYFF